jgi:hypothetical protein
MNNLILREIFNCQMELTIENLTPWKFKNKYMEWTMKRPLACNLQATVSGTEDWIGKLDKIIINSVFLLF